MNDLFEWSVAFPGIDLVNASIRNEFVAFVQRKYRPQLKKKYKIISIPGLMSLSRRTMVDDGTNIDELYCQIKKTSEYRTLQNTIEDTFFATPKSELIACVSANIKGFTWTTVAMQEQFIKALISDFSDTLLSSKAPMSIESFKAYIGKVDISRIPASLCYLSFRNEITQHFFSTQRKRLISAVSQIIPGFALASATEQDKFLFATISFFVQKCIKNKQEISYESFQAYIREESTIQGFANSLSLQNEITQQFFRRNKEKLITVMSKTIPGFVLVTEAEQEEVTLDLLPLFIQECIVYRQEMNADHFLKYMTYLIKNKQLKAKHLAERNRLNEHYKRLQPLIERNMLKALREAFDFLFLLPCKDEELKALAYVFDFNMDVQAKVTRLIQYFNDIHQQGKILIENGYQEDAAQETQSLVTWGLQSLLAIPGVRDIGAAVALLTRFGFLHEGNGGFVAEVGNTISVADHAHIAGKIRKLFHTIYLPLQPLAKEWFVILPSETNWIKIAMRFLMPILVASIIIALGFLLISSIVSMPAIFELLMIIPLTYLGFVVASGLISMRDFTYESVRNWIYNGKYNTPDYQTNITLKTTFGEDIAPIIREYYVTELQKCDDVISYNARTHQVALKNDMRNHLQANGAARKQTLLAEWSILSGASRIEKPDVDISHQLIKKRVKLDSTNQADLLKKRRNEYLSRYCKALHTQPDLIISTQTFFQDRRVTTLKSLHEPDRKKLEKLQEIDTALRSLP